MRPTALIVEDHDDLRRLFAVVLDDAGFAVEVALDGEQALALAHSILPAVITLDLNLPGRPGVEVLAALKAAGDMAAIPVVVISAVPEELPQGVRPLANAVLTKPCSVAALVETVSTAAGGLCAA